MSHWIAVTTTIALGLIGTLGCSLGAHPHDCKYAAYGGLIDRVDRVHGRVGSVLDPALVVTENAAEMADPEPTPAAAPPPGDDETFDLPEPREAEVDQGHDTIHVDQGGSILELLETQNSGGDSLSR